MVVLALRHRSCIAFLLRSAIPCVSWRSGWRCRSLNDGTVTGVTAAGAWFLKEGRSVVKKMQITRQQCQQIANGWRGQLAIAVDNIVRPERTRQMIVDFYRHFDDVELLVFQEVFSGVGDALSDGRVELAIGATRAIPVGGRYAFRDMGMLSWSCVVASHHPLALMDGPFSDDTLRNWPSLVREDTSRNAT